MAKLKAHNPYIAGKALGQDKGFWGREDIFQVVETELRSPEQNAVVLSGQRRIGKTSILLQLQRRLSSDSLLPVYFDLMDRANRPLEDVLFELSCAIATEAEMPPVGREAFEDAASYFRKGFLPALYERLGTGRRPVLLLDEFDVLDVTAVRRPSHNTTSHALFPYLRRLMEGEPRLGFVFVVGRKTEDLSTDVKATFKAARNQRVSILDEKNATELITTAQRQGTLSFSALAVERILALTAGHPYFTQLFCQLLWDHAYAAAGESVPNIDESMVDAVVPKVLEAGENIFEWIWDGLPAAERVIFAAVAATADEHRVTKESLVDILQQHGMRILTGELEVAPDKLVKWEMLRETEQGYRFFVELLRRWIRLHKPLAKVKDDLDRVEPFADTLYQGGVGFHQQGNAEKAQDQLRDALRYNPNHLKARLLLGQILLERQKVNDAVREFEEAYRRDPDAARYRLIQALLVRGEELERIGADKPAVGVFQRVLQLSPKERVAHERLAAAWRRIGDECFHRGDLEEAAVAYENAGQPEQVAEIAALKKQRELDLAVKEAHTFELEENWGKAAELYQVLASKQPDNFTWQAARDRMSEELILSRQYSEGLWSIECSDWPRALRSLAYVIHQRPDYKDAAVRLAQAIYQQQVNSANGPSGFLGQIDAQKQQLLERESSLSEKSDRLARVESALSARHAEIEEKTKLNTQRETRLQQREEELRNTSIQWRVQAKEGAAIDIWLSLPEATLGADKTLFIETADGTIFKETISVPKGIRDGAEGESVGGAGNGKKLRFKVHVLPHPTFRSQGDDVEVSLPITAEEAQLGTAKDILTLEGTKILLRVPPGTRSGQRLRIRGKGLIKDPNSGLASLFMGFGSDGKESKDATEAKDAKLTRGDLYVVVRILAEK